MNGVESFEGLRKLGDSNETHLKLVRLMQDEILVQTKWVHSKRALSWDTRPEQMKWGRSFEAPTRQVHWIGVHLKLGPNWESTQVQG
jgi:hypothetical protein